jgi:hypothetical protein
VDPGQQGALAALPGPFDHDRAPSLSQAALDGSILPSPDVERRVEADRPRLHDDPGIGRGEWSPLPLGRYRGVGEGDDPRMVGRRSDREGGATRDRRIKKGEQLHLRIAWMPKGVLDAVQV